MKKTNRHEIDFLKQHLENYNIWVNSKDRFQTYVPMAEKPKGRIPLTAVSREKLEEKIISFYREQERIRLENERMSNLASIYPKWIAEKELETTAMNTIHRIDADWRRYYLHDPIIKKDIRRLTKADFKEWALRKIRTEAMTKRQYYNMAIIIRQCLEYAVEHEVLSTNLYTKFKVDGKLFRKLKKPEDSTQVFLIDERPLIEAEAWKDFEENGYTTALAIPLAFQTGLRLGELTALKTTDVCSDGKYLHVQRMAQRADYKRADGTWCSGNWVIADHTKTAAGERYVFLTEEARRIIRVIADKNIENHVSDNDFLFLKDGRHIKPSAIIVRIRKYCNRSQIAQKSMHKIRKSYISALLDAGININEVRKQVGHEDERTTLHNYCFNRNSKFQNEAALERALAE